MKSALISNVLPIFLTLCLCNAYIYDDYSNSYEYSGEFSDEVKLAGRTTNCDFEDDWCSWRVRHGHWTRSTSAPLDTGAPPHDHTLGKNGTGHFMRFATTVYNYAYLDSPQYHPYMTKAGCFSFWYYMNSGPPSKLVIFFHSFSVPWKLMYVKTGNQGDKWLHGIFDLPNSVNEFKISIGASSGETTVPIIIAIDDVAILQGSDCDHSDQDSGPNHKVTSVSTTKATTRSPTTTSPSTIRVTGTPPARKYVDPPTRCNFEDGTCMWIHSPNVWRTTAAQLGTEGPSHDHTFGKYGTGHFMHFVKSNLNHGHLISPSYNASLTEAGCFSFWYYMNSSADQALEIYFRAYYGLWESEYIRTGNQGDEWLHGIFHLPKSVNDFQISINAGSDEIGIPVTIAVDDLEILQGTDCHPHLDHKVTSVSTSTATTPLPEIISTSTRATIPLPKVISTSTIGATSPLPKEISTSIIGATTQPPKETSPSTTGASEPPPARKSNANGNYQAPNLDKNQLGWPAIFGIVFGVFTIITAIVMIVIVIRRKYKRQDHRWIGTSQELCYSALKDDARQREDNVN